MASVEKYHGGWRRGPSLREAGGLADLAPTADAAATVSWFCGSSAIRNRPQLEPGWHEATLHVERLPGRCAIFSASRTAGRWGRVSVWARISAAAAIAIGENRDASRLGRRFQATCGWRAVAMGGLPGLRWLNGAARRQVKCPQKVRASLHLYLDRRFVPCRWRGRGHCRESSDTPGPTRLGSHH